MWKEGILGIGGSTGTVASPTPEHCVNLLMNNGWNCLWRGHPVQLTNHLMPHCERVVAMTICL